MDKPAQIQVDRQAFQAFIQVVNRLALDDGQRIVFRQLLMSAHPVVIRREVTEALELVRQRLSEYRARDLSLQSLDIIAPMLTENEQQSLTGSLDQALIRLEDMANIEDERDLYLRWFTARQYNIKQILKEAREVK